MSRLPFSLMLALRYVMPRRVFLWIIAGLSVGGVILGTSSLIITLAVMNGFGEELKRKILSFDAHMVVTESERILYDWRETMEVVEQDPDVVAVTPFMLGPVIAEYKGMISTPKIRGIDVETEPEVSQLKESVVVGEYDLEGEKAIIGVELANQMNLGVGDVITIYAPSNFDEFLDELNALDEAELNDESRERLKSLVLPQEIEVSGIFRAGRYNYDSELIYIPLWLGQELYRLGDGVHGVAVRTKDPYEAAQVQDRLFEKLPVTKNVQTWSDLNRQLLEAVRVERNLVSLILFIAIIVAGFLTASVTIVVTVLRTKEIGILKALGARPWQIINVFQFQGIMIGVIGVIGGVLLGLFLVANLNVIRALLASVFQVEIFPASVYQFTEIPAEISPMELVRICAGIFLVSVLSGFIPALNAAFQDPVKALRQE